jgi:hypothetical protein
MSTPQEALAASVQRHLEMQLRAWKEELTRLEPERVAARRAELEALIDEVEKDEISIKVPRPRDLSLTPKEKSNDARDRTSNTGVSGPRTP